MDSKWISVNINELFDFKYGKALTKENRNELGLVDVYGSNGVVGKHDTALTAGPTIIIGRKGSVGEINFSHKPCYPIDTTYFIDEFWGDVPPKYWVFYLKSLEIGNHDKSSAVPGISRQDIYKVNIPLPPLNEQRRIVAKLEKLLAKVDACKQRLEKIPTILARFRQSVLAAACSGRLTADWREQNPDVEAALKSELFVFPGSEGLAELPELWYYTYITPLLSRTRPGLKTGPFGTMLKKHEHQTEGVPVLGIENISALKFNSRSKIHITSEKAKELSAYSCEHGDVLISRSGTVGEVCVVPEGLGKTIISTNLIRVALDVDKVIPFFFCMLFNGSQLVLDQVSDLCKGSTRDFLNQKILSSIIFPLPPLAEQQEIVRRVEALFQKADRIQQRYEKAKAHIDQLTHSILAKAFRGELVPQDPNDEPASVLLDRIREERANQPQAKTAKKPTEKTPKATEKRGRKKAQPPEPPESDNSEPIQLKLPGIE
ncbi:restriction endonuclease subunit S [Laspinema olomoucense]|uniref:restriction endonuclease subunit S n=1 Tax=Laspinema olomoucense TaxID=3231600 RepID=UPI0021BB0BA6|nr:restriction endonuclease subunit S [Laspinema sp. D3a]MCT7988586.1 restriction endonuclease subunit S [Laspinema sp. D3a]